MSSNHEDSSANIDLYAGPDYNDPTASTGQSDVPPSTTGTQPTGSFDQSKETASDRASALTSNAPSNTGGSFARPAPVSESAIEPVLKLKLKRGTDRKETTNDIGEEIRATLRRLVTDFEWDSSTLEVKTGWQTSDKSITLASPVYSVPVRFRGNSPMGVFFEVRDKKYTVSQTPPSKDSTDIHEAVFRSDDTIYEDPQKLRRKLKSVILDVPEYEEVDVAIIDEEVWAVYRLVGETQRRVVGYLPTPSKSRKRVADDQDEPSSLDRKVRYVY